MAKNLFPLIAKRIDSIPTLPLTLSRLRAAVDRLDVSTEEIVDLVQSDPALTGKVLKVINNPFYGLRSKISTLSHAIAMLGRPALRELATGIATFQDDVEELSGLDQVRNWMHSFAVGIAARIIAEEAEYDLPEEAYIAGLLHDLGKIVLDLYAPDVYREVILGTGADGDRLVDRERSLLGMDHAQVGALVAEQWNLPTVLKDVIQLHHEPADRHLTLPDAHSELLAIVTAANHLCRAFGLGPVADDLPVGDGLTLPCGTSMTSGQIDRVLAAVEAGLERMAVRFDVPYENRESFLLKLQQANRDVVQASRPSESQIETRIYAISDVVGRARRAQSVPDMLDISLSVAQQQLGFDRLLYLQVDLEEQTLNGRHFYDDTHIEVDVTEIQIPLNPDGLVGHAIRGRSAQRVDNWATDGDVLRYLGVVEVAAAPVIVSEQPQGIICGDTFFRNVDISDSDVALLGVLATDLSLAMENHVLSRQATKLQALASKDELTGVHNRRSLMSLLQREVDRAHRYGSPLSAVMVDLDTFKAFNDNYGHMVGDEILREVAQVIVATSREIDVIGRYGGDEFLLVLPETDQHQATVYAERVRSGVESLGRETRKRYPLCSLSLSIGVTSVGDMEDSLETLVHRADHALLAAKQRGKNRVCLD